MSYRRMLLDRRLAAHVRRLHGVVLDLGGKRVRKRGAFRPPEMSGGRWVYVNLARDTRPDVCGDVMRVPLRPGCADGVLCTEVWEHLPDPAACVEEARRLLKPGGILLASTPFLYPVHADPHDYQRFTADGLRRLLRRFASVHVEAMGGWPGTVGMLIELGIPDLPGPRPVRGLLRRALTGIARLLYWVDGRLGQRRPSGGDPFPTGYFVVAVR